MKLQRLIVPLTALACFEALSRPALGAAAAVVANYPYVHGMKQGVFYARCIPSAKFGSAGFTEVYSVGMEKDERVARCDWNGWHFFYTHKPPGLPGGHFAIQVDDETRAAQFMGVR